MEKNRKSCCFLIFSFLLGFFLISCANSVPEVVNVNGQLVCDFQTENSIPDVRLSVFAEISSDIRRASSLIISNEANGYEWRVESPVSIDGSAHKWTGHAFLVYPNRSRIQAGTYNVTYVDVAGKKKETSFSVSFPDGIFSAKSSELPNILGENFKETVAIYSDDKTLIYYDSRKRDWKNDEDIFAAYEAAESYRICYTNGQNSVLCMMPPVLRDVN